MPLSSSAKIALRKDRRRTIVNKRVKTIMRLTMRAVRDTKAPEALPKAYQAIDRAVKKNLLHMKKAARLKSQLSKVVERPGSSKKTTTPEPTKAKVSKKSTATKTTAKKAAPKKKVAAKKTTKKK